MYAPLWVKSNFSFLEGASHPQELVERAHALGLPALAITDRDGVSGLVRAHVRARELGLKLLCGAQVTVGAADLAGLVDGDAGSLGADNDRPLVLLARTREGHSSLCRLLSRGHARGPRGQARVSLAEVAAAREGLTALCLDPDMLPALREPFAGELFALCPRHREARERETEARARAIAARLEVPIVAGHEVLYHDVARRPLQDILTCVRHGATISTASAFTRANAEHALHDPRAMQALFHDDPAALARTLEIAERCAFNPGQLRYRYPSGALADGTSEADRLRALTFEGARGRYGGAIPADVQAQLERELQLIDELDYGGYFLTMWELVQFCRREGILCQGRGSAANSSVCYCLGITAVDPVRMDLLFERFISRERAEPPDIDLDIEHQRREEVIQHVYARHGRRHAAMVATVIRYRPRSAIREVGKVLELPPAALDRAAKLHDGYGGELSPTALAAAGLDREDGGRLDHFRRLVTELLDTPRHLATHPGGFLLGHEPVDSIVPIEPAAMPGRTVIQWDKNDVEDLGLFKVDLLGLGALSHVRRCFELIRAHDGLALDMATVPVEDPATYAMACRADTLGVFQIESRAQMAMLPRLRPKTFYDLVVEIALVRPGPIQGEMVHPYLRRRAGEEPIDYSHPKIGPILKRVLGKTLGVPLFQEQVMRLAVLTAGYTPGEADQLRRDMTAWQSQEKIDAHRDRLTQRMIESGVEPEFADRVFAQIRGFGEYGFPESHAASFALIAYVSAWLRCHHLAAFTCALLNSQPMGFYSPSSIVADARRHGIEVRPVDVQQSQWECSLEPATAGLGKHAIRLGLGRVRGLGERERAVLEDMKPPFADLEDFARRTKLSKPALQALAEAGAFESMGLGRREALWALRGLAGAAHDALRLPGELAAEQPLFAQLTPPETLVWDYRRTGHSTRGHPMQLLRPTLRSVGLPRAREVNRLRDGQRVEYAGMVICRQQPQTAAGVTFYTLEDETGFVNLVVWRPVFARHPILARTLSLMGVSGRMQVSKDRVAHLIVDVIWDPREHLPGLELRPATQARRGA
ncbi:MAG: error-prone DNA polymerase [Nannocystaceae bacterium]